ncbi:MAG: hypothetical protein KDD78_02730 [Caldilineaceae bacterium]|nr:hypothetical protein [Caldilineaceae bacterium]
MPIEEHGQVAGEFGDVGAVADRVRQLKTGRDRLLDQRDGGCVIALSFGQFSLPQVTVRAVGHGVQLLCLGGVRGDRLGSSWVIYPPTAASSR